MQGGRGRGGDPFFNFGDSFGGFGSHRNMLSGFFGGRDLFEDPFFTQPFGSMFPSPFFGPPMGTPFMNPHAPGFHLHDSPPPKRLRGPIIEELNSDDEKEDEKDKAGNSGIVTYTEDSDDVEDRKRKQVYYKQHDPSIYDTMQSQPQTRSFSFQSSSVTYGGANGAYYTSSTTRRAGSDGVTFEESKEANTMTGQASHRISRGIHNKGHSLNRKLSSDGRVDNMQTLHNLNEDELDGFEEAWKVKGGSHYLQQPPQPGSGRNLRMGGNHYLQQPPQPGSSRNLSLGGVDGMNGSSHPHKTLMIEGSTSGGKGISKPTTTAAGTMMDENRRKKK